MAALAITSGLLVLVAVLGGASYAKSAVSQVAASTASTFGSAVGLSQPAAFSPLSLIGSTCTYTPGAPDFFEVDVSSPQTVGVAFGATITAENCDSTGHIFADTSYTGNHTLVFSGPGNAPDSTPPSYSNPVNFSNGVGTETATLFKAETTTLTATEGSVTGTSNTFVVLPGASAKLVFTTQPVGNVSEGVDFSTSPSVSVEDSHGNVATGDGGLVTLAINSYSAGNGGTTQGTLTCSNAGFPAVNASSGVVNYTNCQISGAAGAGTYTLIATRSGLTSTGPSNNVVINAGTAASITATSGGGQSENTLAAFTNPLVATVKDSFGNAVSGASVTFAGPASGASETFAGCAGGNPQPYSCVVTTAANGTATSSTFTANATGGTYTVAATAPGAGTANFSETNVAVNTTLTFTTAGSHTVTVPPHVTSITFSMKAGGGAGGVAAGGAGGTVSGTINFPDSASSTTLTVIVGGGGTTTGAGGGGGAGCAVGGAGGAPHGSGNTAGGGGATCVYVASGSPIAIVGGGGAGSARGAGGAGSGGTTGGDGASTPFGGHGGNGAANGAGGSADGGTAGSAGTAAAGGAGGDGDGTGSSAGGGGGGGGYGSGGGGGGGLKNKADSQGGAGGGGSGYSGGDGTRSVTGASTGTGGNGGPATANGGTGSASFTGVGLT